MSHKSQNFLFKFLENLIIYVFRINAAQKIIGAYYFLLSLEEEIRLEGENPGSYNKWKNLRLSNDGHRYSYSYSLFNSFNLLISLDMAGLEPSEVGTETLLNEIFKAPEIVKNNERKLEHEIYQTNQSIQNLKQKIEIQRLESKNLLEAYDNVEDILKEL